MYESTKQALRDRYYLCSAHPNSEALSNFDACPSVMPKYSVSKSLTFFVRTVCPRGLDLIYIEAFYIKWGKTSKTDGTLCIP